MPDEAVKVADWGVAKNIEMDGLWEGSIVGTRPYMPPEVLARMDLYRPPGSSEPQRIDHRADIFSLGATVFKIVTGKHPFKSPHDIGNPAHRAAQEAVLAAAVGPSIAAAVMVALEHDADARYGDALQFAAAMNAAFSRGDAPRIVPPRPAATLEDRLEEVSSGVKEGNRDGSGEARYRSIIADFPDDPRPYLEYARFCASFRTHEDAVHVLSEGITNVPGSPDLHFQRGRIYRGLGKVSAASEDLAAAVRLGLDAEKVTQAERLLARLREAAAVVKG